MPIDAMTATTEDARRQQNRQKIAQAMFTQSADQTAGSPIDALAKMGSMYFFGRAAGLGQ